MTDALAHLTEAPQDDRPSAYWEGDVAIFRSSAIGGCDKELIGLLMGMEPMPNPPWMQTIFDKGHELEPYIIKAASAKTNLGIEGSQHEVEFDVAGKALVRSHLDGLAFTAPNPHNDAANHPKFIVEAKGLGKTYFKNFLDGTLFDVLPQYAWQISVQMHELELPVLYVVYDKTAGDPWDMELDELLDATHIKYITEPPISKGEIRKKVLKILSAADAGDLPVDCPIKGGFCSTPYLHEDDDDPLAEFENDRNLEEEERTKVATLARTYSKARAAESRAKAAKKEASERLKNYLDDLGLQSVDAGTAKVTTVTNRRKRLDKKGLAEFLTEHGRDISEFQSEYEYSYTKVTDREDAA